MKDNNVIELPVSDIHVKQAEEDYQKVMGEPSDVLDHLSGDDLIEELFKRGYFDGR